MCTTRKKTHEKAVEIGNMQSENERETKRRVKRKNNFLISGEKLVKKGHLIVEQKIKHNGGIKL